MRDVTVRARGHVEADTQTTYAILADYRTGHPAILPEGRFVDWVVERGGQGAGTVASFGIKTFGLVRPVRIEVYEPEPGRVLAEVDTVTTALTTFTVDPAPQGGSLVDIETKWTARGLRGVIESLLAPGALRRVYAIELENLRRVAAQQVV